MIRKVLGIDVGLASASAGVYGYDGGANLPRLLGVFSIPTYGEEAAKRILATGLQRLILQHDPDAAYIENATTMPAPEQFNHKTGKRERRGMGAATMGRYMRAVGAIEATVMLCGLDAVFVMPGVWQRALGLTAMRKALGPGATPNAKKNCSVTLARHVFPEHAATTFKFMNSHNLAEGALISLYGAARCDLVDLRLN